MECLIEKFQSFKHFRSMNDEPTNQRITDKKKGLTPPNQPTIKLINTPASDAAAKIGQWILV
jgi:hypothetical protein